MPFTSFTLGDVLVIASVLLSIGSNWQKLKTLGEIVKDHDKRIDDVNDRVTYLEAIQQK